MSSSPDAEANAFLAWVNAVLDGDDANANANADAGAAADAEADAGARSLESIEDLCDGVALFDVLAAIDPDLFRNPHGADVKGNWVLTIGTLKRLYKLMMQYYAESLQCSTQALPAPDLNAIARSSDKQELNKLCLLAIGIAVQSDQNDLHIAAIQTLAEQHQHQLMMAIASIMDAIKHGQQLHQGGDDDADAAQRSRDGDAADASDAFGAESREQMAQDLARLRDEKATLQTAYIQLAEEHRNLQDSLEESKAETREATAELAAYRKSVEESRNEQADVLMRQEIERLKIELRKSEDNLAAVENDHEKLNKANADLARRADELQRKADEGSRYKDQLDEFKHAADKLQKAENAIEKYKKKLEEGADIRRQLKALEDQNADLVNRNASLEDEYKRVSAFKPLMDSYKTQIVELESKASNLQRDLNTSKYEREQVLSRLRANEEQRAKEKEEMELYQDRIRELELGGGDGSGKRKKKAAAAAAGAAASTSADRGGEIAMNGAEGLVAANDSFAEAEAAAAGADDDDDDDEDEADLTSELDDALTGTTMTDLKIRVRKLSRELEAAQANKADQSRILVLENLLEDAQRMKSRYESDYLREHREKMILQSQIEAIRSGKSDLGDGTEAAYALRLRLNEVVEELDQCKRELTALQVKHEQVERELTVAKSDLTLVNKDQVDILHSLRASVEVEKSELASHIKRLQTELKSAQEQNQMSMAQVNSLLMEKVDLQSEGIGQREEALKRERALGELRVKLSGKGLPKEVEEMVASLQTETLNSQRDLKMVQERLGKAKVFIRQQDRMLKEKEKEVATAAAAAASRGGGTGEGGARQEVERLKKEQRLMMSAYQDLGRRYMVELEARAGGAGAGGAGAARKKQREKGQWGWLARQRSGAAGVKVAARK
ncbi:hypothetical protein ACQY0O_004621 [Thecaphora frezii]